MLREIPQGLAETDGRDTGYWPLIQLIKDWNIQPEARELMLAGGLPEGTDTQAAAKISVVVHALCTRDTTVASTCGPKCHLSRGP